MKKNMLIITLMILIILPITLATDLSSCQAIATTGGTYTVTQDLIDNTQSICLTITGNNNIIDFQGHKFDSNHPTNIGIYVVGNNNTIKNLLMTNTNYSDSIYFSGTDNKLYDSIIRSTSTAININTAQKTIIDNVTAYTNNDCSQDIYITDSDGTIINNFNNLPRTALGCEDRSILIINTDNVTISNSEINQGIFYSIQLGNGFSDIENNHKIFNNILQRIKFKGGTTDGTIIYNNKFLNNNPIYLAGGGYDDATGNYLNTTPQTGERIYSFGNEISGNYYVGYSEDCLDTDLNGFCDNPLISTGLTDNNPLTDLPPDFIEPQSLDTITGDVNIIVKRDYGLITDDSNMTLAVYANDETNLLNTSNAILLIENFTGNETSLGTSGLNSDTYILVVSREITGLRGKGIFIVVDNPTQEEILAGLRNGVLTLLTATMIILILFNIFSTIVLNNENIDFKKYYLLVNKVLIIIAIITIIGLLFL